MKLDFMLFGNGHGMAVPWRDSAFYWLVDVRTKQGAFYHWSGWFGAQLASYQWRRPKAGEERMLLGRYFVISHAERRWGRVACSWCLCRLSSETDEASRQLRELQNDLRKTP